MLLTDCEEALDVTIRVQAPLQGKGDEVGFGWVVLEKVIQQASPRGSTSTVDDMINRGQRGESKTK